MYNCRIVIWGRGYRGADGTEVSLDSWWDTPAFVSEAEARQTAREIAEAEGISLRNIWVCGEERGMIL